MSSADCVDDPVDHPHGGGRGKSKGNVHSVSPWGTLVYLQPSLSLPYNHVNTFPPAGQIRIQDSEEEQPQQVDGDGQTEESRQEEDQSGSMRGTSYAMLLSPKGHHLVQLYHSISGDSHSLISSLLQWLSNIMVCRATGGCRSHPPCRPSGKGEAGD